MCPCLTESHIVLVIKKLILAGSYNCSCQKGYSLQSNGRKCKAQGILHSLMFCTLENSLPFKTTYSGTNLNISDLS